MDTNRVYLDGSRTGRLLGKLCWTTVEYEACIRVTLTGGSNLFS